MFTQRKAQLNRREAQFHRQQLEARRGQQARAQLQKRNFDAQNRLQQRPARRQTWRTPSRRPNPGRRRSFGPVVRKQAPQNNRRRSFRDVDHQQRGNRRPGRSTNTGARPLDERVRRTDRDHHKDHNAPRSSSQRPRKGLFGELGSKVKRLGKSAGLAGGAAGVANEPAAKHTGKPAKKSFEIPSNPFIDARKELWQDDLAAERWLKKSPRDREAQERLEKQKERLDDAKDMREARAEHWGPEKILQHQQEKKYVEREKDRLMEMHPDRWPNLRLRKEIEKEAEEAKKKQKQSAQWTGRKTQDASAHHPRHTAQGVDHGNRHHALPEFEHANHHHTHQAHSRAPMFNHQIPDAPPVYITTAAPLAQPQPHHFPPQQQFAPVQQTFATQSQQAHYPTKPRMHHHQQPAANHDPYRGVERNLAPVDPETDWYSTYSDSEGSVTLVADQDAFDKPQPSEFARSSRNHSTMQSHSSRPKRARFDVNRYMAEAEA